MKKSERGRISSNADAKLPKRFPKNVLRKLAMERRAA